VELIGRDGGRAYAVRADLGDAAGPAGLLCAVEQGLREHTGAAVLDILVNNAAAAGGPVPPEQVTAELLDRYLAVNTLAPFLVAQRALALLPAGGRIINISSGITRSAQPDMIAYAISKGGIDQITLPLAKPPAPPGITVNTVAPGRTDNGSPVFSVPAAVERMAQLSAFKRVGAVEDIADVVAFVASDEARWITGAFLDASGGSLLG